MSKKNQDKVLSELLSKQLKKIDTSKKLDYSDIRRLTKYIDKSIFNTNECILWKGYITNLNKKDKGTYVNFFFKNKKYALHRLLYINYIGPLYDDEYLKFTCENKGSCCNINHFTKLTDKKTEKDDKKKDITDKKQKEQNLDIDSDKIIEQDIDFTIDFE